MSKLSSLCDRFIEAGWLAALALVQLYANSASSLGNAVDKAHLLRIIVLLMVAAWIMKLWEEGTGRGIGHLFSRFRKNPLAVPVLAYVLVILLTTITSVAPSLSFSGSFERLQGAYTTLTYAAFFCLMAANLKSREQLDRIIAVIVLSSIPISLYAVAQQMGLDPTIYAGPGDTLMWAARSTMGNHLFLGAYLIMVMPWSAARLVDTALGYLRQDGPGDLSGRGIAFLATGSLLVQNIALTFFLLYGLSHPQLWWTNLSVLTAYLFLMVWTLHLKARVHPLIAVAAYTVLLGLQGAALLLTQARGPWLGALAGAVVFGLLMSLRWRMRRLLAGLVVGTVLAALFVALLNIPRGPLEPLKQSPILYRLGSLSAFESGSVKFRLLLWESVWRLVWTRPQVNVTDSLTGVRPLVGYGPETLGLVVEKALDPRLVQHEQWKLKDRAHNDLLNHLAEGGLLGLAAFLLLLASFYRFGLKALWREYDSRQQICLIALLAAMTAHLVELLFGIGVTSTRFLFWVFLALAVFLARPLPESESEELVIRPSPWKSWMVPYVLYVALTVFLITVVGLRISFSIVGIYMTLLVALAGMVVGIALLARELGPLSGEHRTPLRRVGFYTIVLGVAVLLIYRLSFRPQAANTIFTLGQTDPRQTILALQQAAIIEPGESAYQVALGRFLMQVGLVLLSQKPDLKPPEGFKPDLALARTLRAERMLPLGGDGVLGLAEASVQEARRVEPLDVRYVYLLGRLNHYWGLRGNPEHLDLAIRYYKQASDKSPNRTSPPVHVALAYLAKKQPLEALEQVRAAQALGRDSWSIHYALALIYHQMGKTELMLEEEKAVALRTFRRQREIVPKLLEQGKLQPAPIPGLSMD